MHPSIRLLPFAASDGPGNMAADEATLESAGRGVGSLRFYTWTEPTLTLGYFQPTAAQLAVPGLDQLTRVRRSTGGAAIVHHHELTYALALPAGMDWQRKSDSWICRFHHLIRDLLIEQGIAAHSVVCGEERKLGEVLCFLDQTPGDLLVEGSKVAGSAQRRLRGSLLQHGSILLRRSEHTPMLAGINDYAGRELFTPEGLAQLLTDRLATDSGWPIRPGNWTETERERIPRIRAEKYANPIWNGKR